MKSTWDRCTFFNLVEPFQVADSSYPILVLKDKKCGIYAIHMLNPRDKSYYK